MALSKANSLKGSGCTSDLSACFTQASLNERNSAQSLAHGSTAALTIGGAALAVGVIVFVTAPSSTTPAKTGATFRIGPMAGAETKGVVLKGEW
jgi:hypothetical protein